VESAAVVLSANSSHRRRHGAISAAALLFYALVMIVLLFVSQQIAWRSHTRQELQDADDAAAHAAACALVTESVFAHPYVSGTSVVDIDRGSLIDNARAVGKQLAKRNPVKGKPLVLKDNPENLTRGELYVGTVVDLASRTFIEQARTHFDPYDPDLNAVRVVTRRDRAGASSTYFVDRDVVGFRLKQPPASGPTFPAIPMVPIAIRSNPCPPAQNNCWLNGGNGGGNTWENQVLARHGSDEWRMGTDPSTGRPVPVAGADGIKEISVTLTEGGSSGDNGQLVYFDGSALSFPALREQVTRGVVYGDLPANNGQKQGQFLLNNGTPTTPNSNFARPATQSLPGKGAAALRTSLLGILGEPRVWMLYSFVQDPNSNNSPTFAVVGFVVARVMQATSAGGQVTVVLQPGVLIADTAVTDFRLRDLGPRSLYNPYVARVRIVE
jgi:hypothetical protein